MARAELYRHYAAECFRLAQATQDPSEREILLSMTAAWRRLAEHAEHNSERETGAASQTNRDA